MPSEVFQLYLMLTLKDYASGGLDRIGAQLRARGKDARETLRDFESLRAGLKRDLAVAGVGIGTLAALRKGVEVAGDFESAMTELKLSIEEVDKSGVPNLDKLNDQMARSQALAVKLGNTLPGSTQDFVQMMTTLRQGGMQTERMLGGGGEAVANLAVVTHANPAELAKEYAQIGEMFQLTTQKEWSRAADISARLFRATGIRPEEQVAGLKFAQIRGGAKLGLKGLEGYESLGRVLGTLRTYGLEGGFGGRELSRFLSQLAEFEKNAAKLKKHEGIDLKKWGISFEFFDKKTHEFKGFDSLFKQLEQLRKLPQKEQVVVGEKLFTAEGTAIATAFMTAGQEGWKKINDRVDAVLPLQQQIVQTTDTWNAKLENVEGTLKNLTATAFTPMLNEVKPLLDLTNAFVGSLQQVGGAHPDIAKVVAEMVALGGVSLTVVGGIRAGTTAWGLYRIASMAALKSTQTELTATSIEAGALSRQMGTLQRMSTGKITFTITAALIGFELISWLRDKQKEYEKEITDAKASADKINTERSGLRQGPPLLGTSQVLIEKTKTEALERWKSFQFGGPEVVPFLDSPVLGRMLYGGHPLTRMPTTEYFQSAIGAQRRPKLIEELRGLGGGVLFTDRALLASLLRAGDKGELRGVETTKEKESFRSVITEAVGDQRVAEAMKLLESQSEQTAQQTQKTNEAFKGVEDLLKGNFTISLNDASAAAQQFAERMNSIMLNPPAPGAAGAASAASSPTPIPRALGGRVLKGVQYVGGERGVELFTPDIPGFIWSHDKLSAIAHRLGAATAGWSPLVREDLDLLGQSPALVPNVLRRISKESRGNPAAINLWDINAKQGHPSIGLMQVIGPTFERYAGPLRTRGIYDPLANIYAGLNYAQHRYPSVQYAMDKPGGYDRGGWLMPGKLAVNLTGRPEAVLTPEESRAFVRQQEAAAQPVRTRDESHTLLRLREMATVPGRAADEPRTGVRLRDVAIQPGRVADEPRAVLRPRVVAIRSEAGPGTAVHHHHHTNVTVHVNVPPGSRAADDPEELARLTAYALEIQLERE